MSRKGNKTPAAGAQAAAPGRSPTVVELAGLRRRLASMLYETMLLLGVLALTFMVPNLLIGMIFEVAPPGWLAWIHVFLVLGFYFVWYWHRQGQTLAMQTWRLKVVDSVSGQPLSAGRSWLRYALAWPSVLIGGVGLIWAIFDRDRQFLHDRLGGSCVVLLPGQPKR